MTDTMKHPTIDPRSDRLSDWVSYGTHMNLYAAMLRAECAELKQRVIGEISELLVMDPSRYLEMMDRLEQLKDKLEESK